MSSYAKPSAKRGGETAEAAVIQRVPEIEPVPDRQNERVDAIATTLLVPRTDLPSVALPLVEADTLVEIKSVMVVYGENQARGRYYLRRGQHEHLRDVGGVYLFAVCEPTPSRSVLAMKLVPATIVADVVSSWIEPADRADYAQLSWGRIFDTDELNRGGPR